MPYHSISKHELLDDTIQPSLIYIINIYILGQTFAEMCATGNSAEKMFLNVL